MLNLPSNFSLEKYKLKNPSDWELFLNFTIPSVDY